MQALAMVVAASTAKSNWNDEDGIGHERERSGGGLLHRCGLLPTPRRRTYRHRQLFSRRSLVIGLI